MTPELRQKLTERLNAVGKRISDNKSGILAGGLLLDAQECLEELLKTTTRDEDDELLCRAQTEFCKTLCDQSLDAGKVAERVEELRVLLCMCGCENDRDPEEETLDHDVKKFRVK